MKFKVKEVPYMTEHYQRYDFNAVKMNGHRIWGASAVVYRSKDLRRMNKWKTWEVDWGTCGSSTVENKEPHAAAINEAMKKARELTV